MKTAIMQPYFFPYLGYWQMFAAVDKFVVLDDVNYIKRGYINSNSILINGCAKKITISLEKPSQNKLINETKLFFPAEERESLIKSITFAYKKASHFKDVFPLIEEAILFDTDDLTSFLVNTFELVRDYLSINTDILISSQIEKDNSLKAEARILEINKRLGSDDYINAIGGRELYSFDHFSDAGIKLNFIQMKPYEYKQFDNEFVSNLSFIDVLMFNSKDEIRTLLDNYELISQG